MDSKDIEQILTHIDLVAAGFRHDEYEHLTIGNVDAAIKCHHGAEIVEQLGRDIREQRLTSVETT